MQTSNYNHPAAPARAIPAGEEPLVTRAKICAQLRAAIQILEEDPSLHGLGNAKRQVQAANRVLFVLQEETRHRTFVARIRIGEMGREKRP